MLTFNDEPCRKENVGLVKLQYKKGKNEGDIP